MAWPGLFEGERQSTTLTAGRTEKIHLRPALKAKAVVLANNNATSGAARGQREIDEWDRQRAHNIHKALSYLHARCTSQAVTDAAENTQEIFDRPIGRASCRERVGQYGSIQVVDVSLNKHKYNYRTLNNN